MNTLSDSNQVQPSGQPAMAPRPCEICAGSEHELLHRQHFLFPGLTSPVHYDVVSCRGCGFAFASDIPNQSTLNQFYQDSVHHLHAHVPQGLSRIHDDFFDFVRHNVSLSSTSSVLDIGSGMGHFLSRFRAAGVERMLGIEPSPAAVALAKSTYGIQIQTDTLDTFAPTAPYDLVSLCGVLEHIADLRTGMERIATLVDEDGHLFIAVPDADSFGQAAPAEAFLEFALEHINFFSATSLDNLLRQAGFEQVRMASQANAFYGNSYLLAVYRKSAKADSTLNQDNSAAENLRAYIAFSYDRLQPVALEVSSLVTSGEPTIIWGAGALTSRLLCDTQLGQANLLCIVDRNPALHGRQVLGVAIAAPDALKAHAGATVLVASTTYAREIATALEEEHHWTGRIITLVADASGELQ